MSSIPSCRLRQGVTYTLLSWRLCVLGRFRCCTHDALGRLPLLYREQRYQAGRQTCKEKRTILDGIATEGSSQSFGGTLLPSAKVHQTQAISSSLGMTHRASTRPFHSLSDAMCRRRTGTRPTLNFYQIRADSSSEQRQGHHIDAKGPGVGVAASD